MQIKQCLRALCLARAARDENMNQPRSQAYESHNIPPHYDGYHVVEHRVRDMFCRMTHTVQTTEPDDERRWRMRQKLIQQREQIRYQQQQHEQSQAGPNYHNSQLQVQNNTPVDYSKNCSNGNSNYPPAYGYPARLPLQFTVSQSAPGAVTQTVAPAQSYGYSNNYSHTQSFDLSKIPPNNISRGLPNQNRSSGADGFHVQQQEVVLYQNGNYPSQIPQPKASICDTPAMVPSQAISHIQATQRRITLPQSSQPASQYNSMVKDVASVPQRRPTHERSRQQFFSNQVSRQRHVSTIQNYSNHPTLVHHFPKTSDAVLNCGAPNQANSHIQTTHGLPNPPQSSPPASQPSNVYNPRQQVFIRTEQNRPIQALPRQQSFSSQVSTVQSQGPTSHGYGSKPVDVHPRVNVSETALISGVPAAPNQAKIRNQAVHVPGHSLQSSQPAVQSSSAYGSQKQDISSVSQRRSLQEVPMQQSFVHQVLDNQDQRPTGHTHVRKDLDVPPPSKTSVLIDNVVDCLVAEYPDYFVDPDFIKKFQDYAKRYKPNEAYGHT